MNRIAFTLIFLLFIAGQTSLRGDGQNGEKLQSASLDFRAVAKNAIPAVVSIQVKGTAKKSGFTHNWGDSGENDGMDDFWERFFGAPRQNQYDKQPVSGQASGFIVSKDGHILTNSHVVRDMTEIHVTLNSGMEYPAKLIGMDANSDIALLKIDADNLPYLKLGNSADLEVGQWVIAIGNPLGLQASLTAGVVSATGRSNLDLSRIEDYIQTDASINKGNSGGPLLNLNSEVVGMNTAIVTSMATGGYMGIGFAIPSNLLNHVMQDLLDSGSFQRGYIGVILQPIDKDLAEAFSLDRAEGVLVAEAAKGSPAEKAGLRQGDVILKYNNTLVPDIGKLRTAISLMKPGTSVKLTVLREGKQMEIPVVVGAFPSEETQIAATHKDNKLGIEVESLTPESAAKYGIKEEQGVIVSKVATSSPFAWAGIKKGSLVLEVNKKKIGSVGDFNSAVGEVSEGKPILLLIKQGDITRFVSIKTG